MKRLIPAPTRLILRIAARWLQDLAKGNTARLAKAPPLHQKVRSAFPVQIELTQPIHVTEFSENKTHNLALAAQFVNDVVIHPDQIFSFWAFIGSPSQRRGYLQGRSLVNQQLQAEYGGGLCQLSGLLYHLALQAGLTILEHHPHSVDLYTDETRFAPLGSDATVVYGYKDLRFINHLSQSLCFHVIVGKDFVTGQLCAERMIQVYQIDFMVQSFQDYIEVETLQRDLTSMRTWSLGKSQYRTLDHQTD